MEVLLVKTVKTVWEMRSYDVWGNSNDGYEVNNAFDAGSVTLRLTVEVNNAGTEHEFLSAYPSVRQIKAALGITGLRGRIDLDGDDLTIYVNRASDSYPLGEMHCTSHASLSPIRKAE